MRGLFHQRNNVIVMFYICCSAQVHAVRWLMIAAITAGLAPAISSAAEQPRRAVLIIDEADPGRGGPTKFSATLRATLDEFAPHVAVYGDSLDLSRFAGPRQEEILRRYLQEKYSDIHFGVIAAVGASALELVKRWRAELWPGVPVVFAAIDEYSAARINVDPDITGLVMHRSINSMVAAARVLVPDLKGVAVVGGALERDSYRPQYLQELPALATELEVINLTGLPLAEQAAHAAALPERTAILYTSLFVDDAGTPYSSTDALAAVAKVANRPIAIDVDTQVGTGAAGGFVLNNVAYGHAVAQLALRILNGASVAALPVAVGEFSKPVFDWRQLIRWQISEATLPGGSEVRFREATAWEQYHTQILIALAALLLQSAIISGLFLERRRRHAAELESRGRLSQVMHLNRSAGLSAISSAVAHELNQPLGAILSNTEAAEILLTKDPPDLPLIGSILADVRKSDQRAAEVISHLRDLLRNNDHDPEVVNLNDVTKLTLEILAPEANVRGVTLAANLDPHPLPVHINRIHLQQVILNLVLNGMDATTSRAPGKRRVSIRTTVINNATIKVTIADSGTGISDDKLQQIFEPFFTTKEKGTGLGLAIARTIIERSGGEISAANRPNGGAVFRFSLPLVKELVT
jgi:signal transduction histidine kinase